jgi:hypothetical protein
MRRANRGFAASSDDAVDFFNLLTNVDDYPCDREILESEKYWFKGSFYNQEHDITGEWSDMAEMYGQILNEKGCRDFSLMDPE